MKPEVVAIGASAGGVEALKIILSSFKRPSHLSVLVVLHFHPEGPNLLPGIYKEYCEFQIKEAESGELMMPETIYIAPPDYHLSAEANRTLSLSSEEVVNFSRPSIDVLLESVAMSYGKKAVGVLLTGANHDGARGMQKIHEEGGLTLVQDPLEADYASMPESALALFKPSKVLGLREMAQLLTELSGVKHE